MAKKVSLIDRIDEITANSVTPEVFEEMCGYTIDEHVDSMMDRVRQLESKKTSRKVVTMGEIGRRAASTAVQPLVALPKVGTIKTLHEQRNVVQDKVGGRAAGRRAVRGRRGPNGSPKGGGFK